MTVAPSYSADQIDLSLLAFSLASIAIKPNFNQASRIVFTTLFHSYVYDQATLMQWLFKVF